MILLFSGGLDSYIAWHYFNQPKTMYVNLRTPYSLQETLVVNKLIPDTHIETCLHLGDRQEGENAYIPFRNMYFAMLAARYSDLIVIAGTKDDMVADKNKGVFERMGKLLSEMDSRTIEVISPFWEATKSQIIRWYLDRGLSKEALLSTISCYNPELTKDNYCGRCKSCFRKWCALYDNGIRLEFYNKDMMEEYFKKACHGYYIKERNESIIKCVEDYTEGRLICKERRER